MILQAFMLSDVVLGLEEDFLPLAQKEKQYRLTVKRIKCEIFKSHDDLGFEYQTLN